jgi:hypothetical protein
MQVNSSGIFNQSVIVSGAWGVALYKDRVYVAQYLSNNTVGVGVNGSAVSVLKASDLSQVAFLKPPSNLTRVHQDTDSGYTGLTVDPVAGKLYVVDQIWKWIPSSAGNFFVVDPVPPALSPGQNITGAQVLLDRVLVRNLE